MTRTWTVHDRVAIRDFVGTPYLLGTIVEISASGNLVIDLGSQPTAIRYPDDVRVIPADQVPIDERHWVPQKTRDKLVRIEAADRLRAMFALVQVPPDRRVGDLLGAVLNPDPALVAGARALLGGEVALASQRANRAW